MLPIFLKLELLLENLPLVNNIVDIRQVVLDNNRKVIRRADINNNNKDISPGDINKQGLETSNLILQNGLLSESFPMFREVIFSEFEFPISISVLKTRYKHLRSQNNNMFYLFSNQLDYTLVYYFAEL